jgi:glutamate carboxypeptidase
LQGGSASNIVPDSARAWGNMRFMSDDAQRAIEAGLASINTPGDELPRVRVRTLVNRPRKPCTPEVESLASAAMLCAVDVFRAMPLGVTGGVCDGNNLQAAGLPVIDTLGVEGGGLHTNTEWIDLNSIVPRAQLSALLLLRRFANVQ